MTPIFKMLSHLMTSGPFLEIFIGKNGRHAGEWRPFSPINDHLPNICLEGGIYVVAK